MKVELIEFLMDMLIGLLVIGKIRYEAKTITSTISASNLLLVKMIQNTLNINEVIFQKGQIMPPMNDKKV